MCELNCVSSILNVQLNERRLVAALRDSEHVFDLRTMKVLHTLNTPLNKTGLCALSPSADTAHCFLAFPASNETGHVLVYNAFTLQIASAIKAHTSPLRALTFSDDGTMLATASNKGTVVRVWSIPADKKLHTFRRGTYGAKVNHLAFNRRGTMIALCSSDSRTVHVFSLLANDNNSNNSSNSSNRSSNAATAIKENKGIFGDDSSSSSMASAQTIESVVRLPSVEQVAAQPLLVSGSGNNNSIEAQQAQQQEQQESKVNALVDASSTVNNSNDNSKDGKQSTLQYLSKKASSISSAASTQVKRALDLLPSRLHDLVDSTRDFAHVHLKKRIFPMACGFTAGEEPGLMVVTNSGHWQRYSIPDAGGEGKLLEEHLLVAKPSEMMGTKLHATTKKNKKKKQQAAAAAAAITTAVAADAKQQQQQQQESKISAPPSNSAANDYFTQSGASKPKTNKVTSAWSK
jgi:hypothetical protein